MNIRKIMAIYNTVIAGGFGIFIFLLFIVPGLQEAVRWYSLDAITASLLVPLFVTLGGYTFIYRDRFEKLKPVFTVQVIYKPVALLLLIIFTIAGRIHPVWAGLIAAALIVYIIGHSFALTR